MVVRPLRVVSLDLRNHCYTFNVGMWPYIGGYS